MNNPLVNIQVRQPMKSYLQEPASSNKMILKRRLQEIQADALTTYSYSTNQQITFSINSVSDLVDFANSYIRLKLTTALSNGGVAQSSRYLAEGGAHALFRSIEVRTASGVLLQRVDRYNKLYAMLSQHMHNKDYVNSVLMKSGDAVVPYDDNSSGVWTELLFTDAGSIYTFSTKTLTLAAPIISPVRLIKAGDAVMVGSNLVGSRTGIVASVTATTIVFTDDIFSAADIISPNIGRVYFQTQSDIPEMRNLAATTSNIMLCFKPLLSVLDTGAYFPLLLLRGGLKIVLQLEDPVHVLAFKGYPNTVTAVDYTITQPVFCVDFVQPSEVLAQQYIDAFKNGGLKYVFPSYKWILDSSNQGQSGTHNLNIQSNVRSARYILSKIQDKRSETVLGGLSEDPGVSSYTCDGVAQGRKAGLEEYRYICNGEAYPLNGIPVRTNDVCAMEALQEVDRALNLSENGVIGKRLNHDDWSNVVSFRRPLERTLAPESDRFIFGANLSKDSNDNFCGADLTLSALQAELKFATDMTLFNYDGTVNGAATQRYIHHFICHDTLMLVSANGTIIFS